MSSLTRRLLQNSQRGQTMVESEKERKIFFVLSFSSPFFSLLFLRDRQIDISALSDSTYHSSLPSLEFNRAELGASSKDERSDLHRSRHLFYSVSPKSSLNESASPLDKCLIFFICFWIKRNIRR